MNGRRRICLISVVAVLGFCHLSSEAEEATKLFPIVQDEKWGYINRAGTVVIKPRFELAESFSEGLAAIHLDGGVGYIDRTGKVVIAPSFEMAESFSEGLAAVSIDKRYGYIDRTGNIVITPQFHVACEFSEGLAAVTVPGEVEKFGFIDPTGAIIIQPQFTRAFGCPSFSEGLALVREDGTPLYIDRTGEVVIKPAGNSASNFSEGLACIMSQKGSLLNSMHYINSKGKVVIPPVFHGGSSAQTSSFSEGFAVFYAFVGEHKLMRCGYIDKEGKIAMAPQFDSCSPFSEGLAAVWTGTTEYVPGKWGFINQEGHFVIAPRHAESFGVDSKFSGGLVEINLDWSAGRWGYLNRRGRLVWHSTPEPGKVTER